MHLCRILIFSFFFVFFQRQVIIATKISLRSYNLIKLYNLTMTVLLRHFLVLFFIRPSARRGLKFTLGRHLRSKRRCSCVLQFTRLRAVSCVLHRPTSRVIHHSRYSFYFFIFIQYGSTNKHCFAFFSAVQSSRQN